MLPSCNRLWLTPFTYQPAHSTRVLRSNRHLDDDNHAKWRQGFSWKLVGVWYHVVGTKTADTDRHKTRQLCFTCLLGKLRLVHSILLCGSTRKNRCCCCCCLVQIRSLDARRSIPRPWVHRPLLARARAHQSAVTATTEGVFFFYYEDADTRYKRSRSKAAQRQWHANLVSERALANIVPFYPEEKTCGLSRDRLAKAENNQLINRRYFLLLVLRLVLRLVLLTWKYWHVGFRDEFK